MNDQKLNIRQFKMMNGEEIIGLVNQKEPSSYIIERPFQIKPTMMGGFSLLPWFPFSSQKLFKIEKEFIGLIYPIQQNQLIKIFLFKIIKKQIIIK